jgi:hypothetical protein
MQCSHLEILKQFTADNLVIEEYLNSTLTVANNPAKRMIKM